MGAGIAIINADRALSIFASAASFPTVGKEGPLYFARDVGKTYRWDFGTAAYVEFGGSAGVTDHGLLTGLADDDHPQYALDTDLAAHEAAADPHPGYLTPAEGNAAYQPLNAQLTTLAAITATQATDLAAVSTFMGTVLNDADAATARATLGADNAANLTGTANININGTVGATTAAAGTFTTVTANGGLTINTDGGATAGSAIDQSAATVSIAASGTKLFSEFSGMILVNNHPSGGVSLFLVGSGSTLKGLTVGTMTGSMSYVSPNYVWTSDSTTTDTYTFTKIRTRAFS